MFIQYGMGFDSLKTQSYLYSSRCHVPVMFQTRNNIHIHSRRFVHGDANPVKRILTLIRSEVQQPPFPARKHWLPCGNNTSLFICAHVYVYIYMCVWIYTDKCTYMLNYIYECHAHVNICIDAYILYYIVLWYDITLYFYIIIQHRMYYIMYINK